MNEMYKNLALTSLLLSAPLVNAASLPIANASFETPALQSGGSVSMAVDGTFYGWKVDIFEERFDGPGVLSITNPLPALAGPVLDGSNVAILKPGTTISQTFNGSLLANAGDFKFSMDFSHLTQSGCCFDWGIILQWQESSVWQSVWITSAMDETVTAEDQITHYEFDTQLPLNFSPDGGLVTLAIINFGASSRDFIIDNVAINVTPVPVPGAAWLFLTGLSTIAGSRLRRNWSRSRTK